VEATVTEPLSPGSSRTQRWVNRRFADKAMRPRNAAILVATSWVLGVIVFGVIERIADPHTFPSVWLAFWWAIQTVTTVGYGDVVPSQTSGKVLASVLMIGGLSFLSVVTAVIASAFVARRQAEERDAGHDPVMEKLKEISSRLDRIEGELSRPPDRQDST
jgi:voltage-gated potassium channel